MFQDDLDEEYQEQNPFPFVKIGSPLKNGALSKLDTSTSYFPLTACIPDPVRMKFSICLVSVLRHFEGCPTASDWLFLQVAKEIYHKKKSPKAKLKSQNDS